jgi:hypothetical protein
MKKGSISLIARVEMLKHAQQGGTITSAHVGFDFAGRFAHTQFQILLVAPVAI